MDPSPALVSKLMELGIGEDSARRALKVSLAHGEGAESSWMICGWVYNDDMLCVASGMGMISNVQLMMVSHVFSSSFPLGILRIQTGIFWSLEVLWKEAGME
jgi:hypothetical protein